MAFTRTTLSAAVAVDDTSITVASATSITADRLLRVDQEWMVVQKSYVSGTSIPVRRGQLGSKTKAHVITAGVVHGSIQDDYDVPGEGVTVNSPVVRARVITSITADNSTVTHAPAGNDHLVILNSTSVINLTVPVPTNDMDGDILIIGGNGIAAHVVTFTGGLGAVGATADVVTFGTTQRQTVQVLALNAVWNLLGPLSTATANVSGPAVA